MAKHDNITAELPHDVYADVEAAVSAGEFGSLGEAVSRVMTEWATMRRIEAEAFTARARAMITESRSDPRPPVDAEDVFDRLEAKYTAMIEAEGHRE